MHISLVVALLTLGLVARVTRLIVDDGITEPARVWINRRADKNGVYEFVSDMTSCFHCTSVWVAAAAVAVANVWGDTAWYQLVALAASISYVAGLFAIWSYSKQD